MLAGDNVGWLCMLLRWLCMVVVVVVVLQLWRRRRRQRFLGDGSHGGQRGDATG